MVGLGSAAAPLPLLGAGAPPVRLGLPLDNRGPVSMAEGASIVVLSSHLTDRGERSYPQSVFTASEEPCVHKECSFNTRGLTRIVMVRAG